MLATIHFRICRNANTITNKTVISLQVVSSHLPTVCGEWDKWPVCVNCTVLKTWHLSTSDNYLSTTPLTGKGHKKRVRTWISVLCMTRSKETICPTVRTTWRRTVTVQLTVWTRHQSCTVAIQARICHDELVTTISGDCKVTTAVIMIVDELLDAVCCEVH